MHIKFSESVVDYNQNQPHATENTGNTQAIFNTADPSAEGSDSTGLLKRDYLPRSILKNPIHPNPKTWAAANQASPSDTTLGLSGDQKSILINIWGKWAKRAPQGERRKDAYHVFVEWLKKDDPRILLRLNYHGLSSFPSALPNRMQHIDVSHNKLARLPSSWPKGLITLQLNQCGLTHFPENLPPFLEMLQLRQNQIESFPEKQPVSLKRLELYENKIVNLPEKISSPLKILDLLENPVKTTPVEWPDSLQRLRISRGLGPQDRPMNLPDHLSPQRVSNWSSRDDRSIVFVRKTLTQVNS